LEAGLNGLNVGDGELHRACAEGHVEGVRAVLSQGLDGLESLGALLFHLPDCLADERG
jgi:hypothetical protein